MSVDSRGCQVLLSGIRGLDQELIEVFLESRRFCPKGGKIAHFVPLSEDQAVVIFEDNQVANGLEKCLIMPDGTKITKIYTEPYRMLQKCKKFPHEANESFEHSTMPDSDSAQKVNNAGIRSIVKLQFSSKKVKIMKLIWELEDLSTKCNCIVKFDEQNQAVSIEGVDGDLASTKLCILEMAHESVKQRVNVTSQIQNLLSSARGEKWMAEEFSKLSLAAVLYIQDGTANLIAKDQEKLSCANDVIKEIVSSQNISFDDNHKGFLQSPSWSQEVQAIESSHLISVHTDYSGMKIEIAGRTTAVDLCAYQISELLTRNRTNVIKHKCGVVRLLEKQENFIRRDIDQIVSSPVQLEFDCQNGAINIFGSNDDVVKTENIIRKKYLRVLCNGTYEISTPYLTNFFGTKQSTRREIIDVLENMYNCVIEVSVGSFRSCEPHSEQGRQMTGNRYGIAIPSTCVEVILGDISNSKADVLVNEVEEENLGELRQFLYRANPDREQNLIHAVPQNTGNDLLITNTGEWQDAKFVFHTAVRRYRNRESVDRLQNLIKKCLEITDTQFGGNSIAFPMLGCSKLGYDPKDVAECFKTAIRNTSTNVQISIIESEEHLLQDFILQFFNESFVGCHRDSETKDDSRFNWGLKKIFSRQRHTPVNNKIVFHINAMSDDVIRDVRENLVTRISEIMTEATIKDEAIADLSDETTSGIEALSSPDVDIKIDRRKNTIVVQVEKSLVDERRRKAHHLVYKEGSKQERNRGSQSQSSIRYPKHWSSYKSGRQLAGKMDHKRSELTPSGGGMFEEVSRLVMKTWEQQKVGHGSDAAGLGVHTIKIRKIFCIENPSLYRTYMSRREGFGLEASVNKYPRVNGLQLQGEREIMTLKLGLRQLDAALASEVNECYLLHGARRDIVDSIERTGLDTRLSGQNVLFGPGTYFTDSSTKADQYADAKYRRIPNGQPLYMYVCRVLLGQTFICQTPKPFKRAPCMQPGCYSDKCPTAHAFVGTFDSVIGTHKSPTVRLIFREFVIYHPDQSYPEFLVEYERQ